MISVVLLRSTAAASQQRSRDVALVSLTVIFPLGCQVVWQGPALATVGWPGVDNSIVPLVFNVTSLTLAQLQSLVLTASYNSGVVLTPQSTLLIDAWAVDITATL